MHTDISVGNTIICLVIRLRQFKVAELSQLTFYDIQCYNMV